MVHIINITIREFDHIIYIEVSFFTILLSLALPILLFSGPAVRLLFLRSNIFLLLSHPLARAILLHSYEAILRFVNLWSYGEEEEYSGIFIFFI